MVDPITSPGTTSQQDPTVDTPKRLPWSLGGAYRFMEDVYPRGGVSFMDPVYAPYTTKAPALKQKEPAFIDLGDYGLPDKPVTRIMDAVGRQTGIISPDPFVERNIDYLEQGSTLLDQSAQAIMAGATADQLRASLLKQHNMDTDRFFGQELDARLTRLGYQQKYGVAPNFSSELMSFEDQLSDWVTTLPERDAWNALEDLYDGDWQRMIPVWGTVRDITSDIDAMRLMQKEANGEKLSRTEELQLEKLIIEAYQPNTGWAEVIDGLVTGVQFAGDLYATGGAVGIAGRVAGKLGGNLMKNVARRVLARSMKSGMLRTLTQTAKSGGVLGRTLEVGTKVGTAATRMGAGAAVQVEGLEALTQITGELRNLATNEDYAPTKGLRMKLFTADRRAESMSLLGFGEGPDGQLRPLINFSPDLDLDQIPEVYRSRAYIEILSERLSMGAGQGFSLKQHGRAAQLWPIVKSKHPDMDILDWQRILQDAKRAGGAAFGGEGSLLKKIVVESLEEHAVRAGNVAGFKLTGDERYEGQEWKDVLLSADDMIVEGLVIGGMMGGGTGLSKLGGDPQAERINRLARQAKESGRAERVATQAQINQVGRARGMAPAEEVGPGALAVAEEFEGAGVRTVFYDPTQQSDAGTRAAAGLYDESTPGVIYVNPSQINQDGASVSSPGGARGVIAHETVHDTSAVLGPDIEPLFDEFKQEYPDYYDALQRLWAERTGQSQLPGESDLSARDVQEETMATGAQENNALLFGLMTDAKAREAMAKLLGGRKYRNLLQRMVDSLNRRFLGMDQKLVAQLRANGYLNTDVDMNDAKARGALAMTVMEAQAAVHAARAGALVRAFTDAQLLPRDSGPRVVMAPEDDELGVRVDLPPEIQALVDEATQRDYLASDDLTAAREQYDFANQLFDLADRLDREVDALEGAEGQEFADEDADSIGALRSRATEARRQGEAIYSTLSEHIDLLVRAEDAANEIFALEAEIQQAEQEGRPVSAAQRKAVDELRQRNDELQSTISLLEQEEAAQEGQPTPTEGAAPIQTQPGTDTSQETIRKPGDFVRVKSDSSFYSDDWGRTQSESPFLIERVMTPQATGLSEPGESLADPVERYALIRQMDTGRVLNVPMRDLVTAYTYGAAGPAGVVSMPIAPGARVRPKPNTEEYDRLGAEGHPGYIVTDVTGPEGGGQRIALDTGNGGFAAGFASNFEIIQGASNQSGVELAATRQGAEDARTGTVRFAPPVAPQERANTEDLTPEDRLQVSDNLALALPGDTSFELENWLRDAAQQLGDIAENFSLTQQTQSASVLTRAAEDLAQADRQFRNEQDGPLGAEMRRAEIERGEFTFRDPDEIRSLGIMLDRLASATRAFQLASLDPYASDALRQWANQSLPQLRNSRSSLVRGIGRLMTQSIADPEFDPLTAFNQLERMYDVRPSRTGPLDQERVRQRLDVEEQKGVSFRDPDQLADPTTGADVRQQFGGMRIPENIENYKDARGLQQVIDSALKPLQRKRGPLDQEQPIAPIRQSIAFDSIPIPAAMRNAPSPSALGRYREALKGMYQSGALSELHVISLSILAGSLPSAKLRALQVSLKTLGPATAGTATKEFDGQEDAVVRALNRPRVPGDFRALKIQMDPAAGMERTMLPYMENRQKLSEGGYRAHQQMTFLHELGHVLSFGDEYIDKRRDAATEAARVIRERLIEFVPPQDPVFQSMFRTARSDYYLNAPAAYSRRSLVSGGEGLARAVGYARGGEFAAQMIGAALDARMFAMIQEAGLTDELGAVTDGFLQRLRDRTTEYSQLELNDPGIVKSMETMTPRERERRGVVSPNEQDSNIDDWAPAMRRSSRELLIDTVQALGFLSSGSLANIELGDDMLRTLAVRDMAYAAARDGRTGDVEQELMQEAAAAFSNQSLLYAAAESLESPGRARLEDQADTLAIDQAALERADQRLDTPEGEVQAQEAVDDIIDEAYEILNVDRTLAEEAELVRQVTAEYVTEQDRQAIRDFVNQENREAQEALDRVADIAEGTASALYIYPTTLDQRARFAAGFNSVDELRQWLEDAELIPSSEVRLRQQLERIAPAMFYGALKDQPADEPFRVSPADVAREAEVQAYFEDYDQADAARDNARMNREQWLPDMIDRYAQQLDDANADLTGIGYDIQAEILLAMDHMGVPIEDNRGRFIMSRDLRQAAFAQLELEQADGTIDTARKQAIALIGIMTREIESGDYLAALKDLGTMYAPVGYFAAGDFVLPPQTSWRKAMQLVRDKYNRIEDLERFLSGLDPVLAAREEADTGFGKAQLSAGTTESLVIEMRRDFQDPIVKLMRDNDLSITDVEDYLMALAAPGANAQLRKAARRADELEQEAAELEQEAKGKQGRAAASDLRRAAALRALAKRTRPRQEYEFFTDADAKRIRDKQQKRPGMAKVGSLVQQMTQKTRRMQRESGIISAETEQRWNDSEPYYVPHRDAEVDFDNPHAMDPMLQRRVFQVYGPVSKPRLGRQSRPSPLAWSFAQHRNAAVASEANKVAQSLVKELDQAGLIAQTQRLKPGDGRRQGGYDFRYFDNGEAVRVTLTDRGLAASMGALRPEVMPKLLRGVGHFTRLLSRASTSWSPDFVARNLARDVETAMLKVGQYKDMGIKMSRAALARDIMAMLPVAKKGLREKPEGANGEFYERWRQAGGMTGLSAGVNVSEVLRGLQSDLKGSSLSSVYHRTFGAIESWAAMGEHAVRAAVFKQLVMNGVSESQAALLSRRVTVDFNRTGLWSGNIGAAYMFFSAGVGGAANSIAALMNSPRFRKYMGFLVLHGMAEEVLFNAYGEEDENDGILIFDKIAPWQKSSHFFIPDFTGGDVPFRVPLPIGLSSFKHAGNLLAQIGLGKKTARQAGIEFAVSTAQAWSPIAGEATVAATLAPSVLDVLVAISTNKAWHGGTIRRPERPGENLPDHLRGPNASNAAQAFTKGIFEFFGGDPADVKDDMFSIDPNTVDYVGDNLFSTAGRSVYRLMLRGYDALAGEVPTGRNRIPGVDAFRAQLPEMDTSAAFYDIKNEVNRRSQVADLALTDPDQKAARDEFKRLVKGNEVQYAYSKAFDGLNSDLKPLRDRMYGAKTTEQRQDYMQRIEQAQGLLIRSYHKAIKRQQKAQDAGQSTGSVESIMRGIVNVLEGADQGVREFIEPTIRGLRSNIKALGQR